MPRNPNGEYFLPAGNPVTSGTIIDTEWANPTLADIANELTNSLSREGEGGMLVPLKFIDGSVFAPGISWVNENRTGFYRAGTNDMRVTINAVDSFRWTSDGVYIWNLLAQTWEKVEGGFQTALETTYDSLTYNNVQEALEGALTAIGTTYNSADSSLAAINVKTALDELAAEIDAITAGFRFRGTWDAALNVPDLLTELKESGDYWVCDVAGTTDLGLDPAGNPLNSWILGDKAVYINVTSPTVFDGFAKIAGTGEGTLANQVIFDPVNFDISFPLEASPEQVQAALDFSWPYVKQIYDGLPATAISYDPTGTGLTAIDVQTAITEVNSKADNVTAIEVNFDDSPWLEYTDVQGALSAARTAVGTHYNSADSTLTADNVKDALDDVANLLSLIVDGVRLRGTWDANVNDPNLLTEPKLSGDFWVCDVAGVTDLGLDPNGDPLNSWQVGDRAIYINVIDPEIFDGFAKVVPSGAPVDANDVLFDSVNFQLSFPVPPNVAPTQAQAALDFGWPILANADAGNWGKGSVIPLIADCNNATLNGILGCGGSTTNAPTTSRGMLTTTVVNGEFAQVYRTVQGTASLSWTRTFYNSTWGAWVPIASGSDLADYLPLTGGTLTGISGLLKLKSTALGTLANCWMEWLDSAGARYGYIGKSSASNDNIELYAQVGALSLVSANASTLITGKTFVTLNAQGGDVNINSSVGAVIMNAQTLARINTPLIELNASNTNFSSVAEGINTVKHTYSNTVDNFSFAFSSSSLIWATAPDLTNPMMTLAKPSGDAFFKGNVTTAVGVPTAGNMLTRKDYVDGRFTKGTGNGARYEKNGITGFTTQWGKVTGNVAVLYPIAFTDLDSVNVIVTVIADVGQENTAITAPTLTGFSISNIGASEVVHWRAVGY